MPLNVSDARLLFLSGEPIGSPVSTKIKRRSETVSLDAALFDPPDR